MAETFAFGSVAGTRILFAFLCAIAAAIGCCCFAVLRYPWSRRDDYRGFGAAGRGLALGCGAIVAGLLIWASHASILGYFLSLEAGHQGITFRYILPERSVFLPQTQVTTIDALPAYKGGWRLVVTSRSGRRFASASERYQPVAEAVKRLRQRMEPKEAGTSAQSTFEDGGVGRTSGSPAEQDAGPARPIGTAERTGHGQRR